MTEYTAHERALIAELEGDDELLRKLMLEYMQGIEESIHSEKDYN